MKLTEGELERLVALSPGSTAAFQLDGQTLHMSACSPSISACLGMTGRISAEHDSIDLVTEADRPIVSEAVTRCMAEESAADISFRLEAGRSPSRWVRGQFKWIGDWNNRAVLMASFTDIPQERGGLDMLLDHLSSIVYICDSQTLELLYANETALSYWGRRDYDGCACYEFIYQRESPCPWCVFPRLKGQTLHINRWIEAQSGRSFAIDLLRLQYQGRPALALMALPEAPSAEPKSGSGSAVQNLLSIINNIPVGICVFREKDGEISRIAVNSAVCAIKGVSESVLRAESGEALFARIHPDYRETVETEFKKLFADHRKIGITYRTRNERTGQYRYIRIEGKAFAAEDGTNTAFIAYSDISAEKEAELAHKRDERIYELAIKLANLMLWRYDPAEKRITILSPGDIQQKISRGSHLPRQIGNVPQSLLPYIDPKEQARFISMYDEIDEGKPLIYGEFRLIPQKPDRMLYISITYTVIQDDTGKSGLVYGMAQDISARKKAEENYFQELQFLKGNDESNLIAKGYQDLNRNRIIDFISKSNKSLSIRRGQSYDDAIEQMAKLPVSEKDREALADLLDREKLISRFADGECNSKLEYRRAKPGQPPLWAVTTVHSFLSPISGNIECFIYTYDLTSRRLESSIIARLTQFGFDYIGLLDPVSRTICYYGERSHSRFNEDPEVLNYDNNLAESARDHMPPDEREATVKAFSLETICDELREHQVYAFAYNRMESDGSLTRKRMQFSYLDSSQNVILFSRSDISEQYRHDREQLSHLREALYSAEKANEAKSIFLSNISHDLRTPLNGVIGFTDLALEEKDAAKKQEYLGKIRISGKLLIDLINDTLDLSKIESGKIVLTPETIDIHDLIGNVAMPIKSAADAKHIAFAVDTSKCGFGLIRADRVNAQKILLNLLSNAVKFTPRGGRVELAVEELGGTEGGKEELEENPRSSLPYNCRIRVSDTGIGISKEFMPKIYQPFAQERRPGSMSIPGTGLGLSIVKHLVDMMGGRIEAASEPGRGTVFTVYLSVQKADPSDAAAQGAAAPALSRLEGLKVLLCEDNALNAEIAKTCLEAQKINVAGAADGSEAVQAFAASAENEIDAILMDLRMPRMDGFEATARIRAMNRADARRVPIIAMSADAYDEDVKKCLESGMNSHIAKPVDFNRLFEELRRLCGQGR